MLKAFLAITAVTICCLGQYPGQQAPIKPTTSLLGYQ